MAYKTKEDVKPQEGRQAEFFRMVADQHADFYMIGGSRFGGKSELMSMIDLLFAGDPYFRSIKFRRQYDEIMGANGLWEKAMNQYKLFSAKPNKSDKSWTFPSGAKALYRHMYLEGDEESHRGKGYSAIMFDEINQFTWDQVKFLQTCLRSEADMQSFMVGTLNPDPDSWCMKFIEYYLDPYTGYPDIDKCGEIRHYIIVDGEPVFGPDEEYFKENYWELVNPVVDIQTGERKYIRPKKFTFFFFNIFDNKIGMQQNPQYIVELNSLPEHERDSQLLGNWFAKPKSVSMFRKEFLKKIDYDSIPKEFISSRAWDKAYAEPSEVNRYPDFTASIKMLKDTDSKYYIVGDFDPELHDEFKIGQDIIYGKFRKGVGKRNTWMLQQAAYDGLETIVTIPEESGAGKGEWEQMRAMFMDAGYTVHGAKTGNKEGGKYLRFATFCSAAEQGLVYIVEDSFPNKATLDAFIKELESFQKDKKSSGIRKDDWVDAVSDAYLSLQTAKVYKPCVVPSFSGSKTRLSKLKTKLR